MDVFAPSWDLLQRLASQGRLDSPWGVTLGPLNTVPGALYFTAGLDHEADGLFGYLVPRP